MWSLFPATLTFRSFSKWLERSQMCPEGKISSVGDTLSDSMNDSWIPDQPKGRETREAPKSKLMSGLDNTRLFMSLTAGAGTRCMSLLSSSPSLFLHICGLAEKRKRRRECIEDWFQGCPFQALIENECSLASTRDSPFDWSESERQDTSEPHRSRVETRAIIQSHSLSQLEHRLTDQEWVSMWRCSRCREWKCWTAMVQSSWILDFLWQLWTLWMAVWRIQHDFHSWSLDKASKNRKSRDNGKSLLILLLFP